MNQQLEVKKDNEHPTDALWWRPVFSLHHQLNTLLRDTLPDFMQPSTVAPSFWEVEEEMFAIIQRNMHRLFSELYNNRQMVTPWLTGGITEPYVDLMENAEAFTIKADVPGLEATDLEVLISDSAVTIKGERGEESAEEGDTYIRRECHSGTFSRTVAIPEEADTENARACFDQNILTIEIPKKGLHAEQSRSLKIETAKEVTKKDEQKKKPELVNDGNEAAKSTASTQGETVAKTKRKKAA